MISKRRERVATRSRLFIWAFISLAGVPVLAADAAWCEAQWVAQEIIPKGVEPSPPGVELENWQALSARCSGTIAYEARLAMLLSHAGLFADARKVLAQPVPDDSPYRYLVDLAEIDVMIAELIAAESASLPGDQVKAVEDRFLSHVKRFYSDSSLEDSVDAMLLFGSFEASLGNFSEAISLLELADRSRKPARGRLALYRNLTVSYAELGRFREAEDAANSALRLSPIVMTSPKFVYALAKSQASLGLHSDARASMSKLGELRADVVGSEEFKATAALVRDKARLAAPK